MWCGGCLTIFGTGTLTRLAHMTRHMNETEGNFLLKIGHLLRNNKTHPNMNRLLKK